MNSYNNSSQVGFNNVQGAPNHNPFNQASNPLNQSSISPQRNSMGYPPNINNSPAFNPFNSNMGNGSGSNSGYNQGGRPWWLWSYPHRPSNRIYIHLPLSLTLPPLLSPSLCHPDDNITNCVDIPRNNNCIDVSLQSPPSTSQWRWVGRLGRILEELPEEHLHPVNRVPEWSGLPLGLRAMCRLQEWILGEKCGLVGIHTPAHHTGLVSKEH